MNQEFDQANKVLINRDDKGVTRDLLHTEEPFVSQAPTPQLAAAEYLDKFGGLLGLKAGETDNLDLAQAAAPTNVADDLRFQEEKSQFDTTTVLYQQTRFGLPIWHAGVAIHMQGRPYSVNNTQSTRHADVDAEMPSAKAIGRLESLSEADLEGPLGIDRTADFDPATFKIEDQRIIIYRYAEEKRAIIEEPPLDAAVFGHFHPTLPLPPVAATVEEGRHYVAAEVHFALSPDVKEALHWVAIIEAETLSVLYLRAFADDVSGQVFLVDPITTNGGPAPGASSATLNPVRASVALLGLTASTPQVLIGATVKLADVEFPTVPAPTQPLGTDFDFDARTDEFAAVNAYFHCDRFFRLMQDLGFDLSAFFGSATVFPSTVDHRGLDGNVVNAHCLGTSGGRGILQTTFALADLGDTINPIGIACDYRVVLHELGGHGVLYPHVNSPNFGFAHSAGDSIAAITCDPETQAPDRFLTFPWVNIRRRHDRAVSAGWGWSGTIALKPFNSIVDRGGYNNEQILSTTMFRFYLSIGGASTELAARQFASRFAVYLILRAIASLTPATNPSNAAGFATALINADLGDWTSAGQAGGAYGKVIRWAFEKQGLYQAAGTPRPNNDEGVPPAVDVYIDDGRHGEYSFQPNHWSSPSVWNRRQPDGIAAHEEPVVGIKNYAYVKVKNRGTQTATNVLVQAYQGDPTAGLIYPNDWSPMNTAQLPLGNVAPDNAAEVTAGPFAWIPAQIGNECMLMVVSAAGDPSNTSKITAGSTIPAWRLVPNDNNIAQRNVSPVAS
jgi:zinc metalloprotease ZmpB